MKRILPYLLGLLLGLSPCFSAFAEDESETKSADFGSSIEEDTKSIAVGTIDILEFDFQPIVIVGNNSIMDAKEGGNLRQIQIIPKKKGTTSVIVQNQKKEVVRKIIYDVTTNDLSQKVIAIRRLLQDIEGITISSVDEKIVIDGELIVPRDLDRILAVQEAYKDVVFNLVSLSKISREAIARRMQREINDDPGGVNVQVKIINDTFFLLGKVDSTIDRERAETIAQTYVPEVMGSPALRDQVLQPGAKKYAIRNLIYVEEPPPAPAPKMVRVTYHFVEIGKEFLKNSFFKWVPLVQEGSGIQFGQSTTGGVGADSGGSFTGLITNLLPKLQSGANGGFARILFSNVGIGEEGQEIQVVRSDNVPYIAAVVNGVPIPENQAVTMSVRTTPTIIGDQKLRLDTRFQFEALAGAGAGGKPRVTSTSMQNRIIINSGESAALGGLIHSDTAKDIDKDPENPGSSGVQGGALFSLLRSKAFRNKKTQFVVFVTPKIINDAAEGTADIKAKILQNSGKKRRRVIR